MQEHLYKCIVFLFLNYLKKQMSFNHLYLIEQHLLSLRRSAILPGRLFYYFIGDFIEISYEIRKKPLQILMSEETLKADVSKYATVP